MVLAVLGGSAGVLAANWGGALLHHEAAAAIYDTHAAGENLSTR